MRLMAAFMLLMALLIASASAQTPLATPGNPSVELVIEVQDDGASLDAPATYLVTVRNTSPASGSGQDPPMDVTLEVSGVPAGWQASLSPRSLQLAAGQEATSTLTVGVSASATEETALLSVDARIENGAFPPLELVGTASESVEVTRDDTRAREATEFFGTYLWWIVGGGVVLYLLSTVMMVILFKDRKQDD